MRQAWKVPPPREVPLNFKYTLFDTAPECQIHTIQQRDIILKKILSQKDEISIRKKTMWRLMNLG